MGWARYEFIPDLSLLCLERRQSRDLAQLKKLPSTLDISEQILVIRYRVCVVPPYQGLTTTDSGTCVTNLHSILTMWFALTTKLFFLTSRYFTILARNSERQCHRAEPSLSLGYTLILNKLIIFSRSHVSRRWYNDRLGPHFMNSHL